MDQSQALVSIEKERDDDLDTIPARVAFTRACLLDGIAASNVGLHDAVSRRWSVCALQSRLELPRDRARVAVRSKQKPLSENTGRTPNLWARLTGGSRMRETLRPRSGDSTRPSMRSSLVEICDDPPRRLPGRTWGKGGDLLLEFAHGALSDLCTRRAAAHRAAPLVLFGSITRMCSAT
jgi:hypothetical protein